MKKLLAVSALSVLLAACSNSSHDAKGPHHPNNPQLEAAMKACHESVGETKDRAKFDECMKAKGFEKPAGHPGSEAADKVADKAEQTADKAEKATDKAVAKTKKVAKKAVKKVKKAVK